MLLSSGAGHAVRLLDLQPDPPEQPPGQGQLLLLIKGQATVAERGGSDGKVIGLRRPDRAWDLHTGTFLRLPNDCAWTLRGRGRALSITTSVPREDHRIEDLPTSVQGITLPFPRVLFSNERLVLELVVAGRVLGRLPWPGSATRQAQLLVAPWGAVQAAGKGGVIDLSPGSYQHVAEGEGVAVRRGVALRLCWRQGAPTWPPVGPEDAVLQ